MELQRRKCRSADGVAIAYSAAGARAPALLFIHGGLSDRTFWDAQFQALSGDYRIVALDLAGHGESGADRAQWGVPEFGEDVRAVADAEGLERIILFGNSLGGPVAIEAALLLPGRALGVVGVDTLHRLDYQLSLEEARTRADAFLKDYSGSIQQMVKSLFHADADPLAVANAEARMHKTPPAAAYEMFLGLAGYNPAHAARRLTIPLRAINGDLYPTDVEGNRKIKPDFEVIVMAHMGHYPMLERPDEFNSHVARLAGQIQAMG